MRNCVSQFISLSTILENGRIRFVFIQSTAIEKTSILYEEEICRQLQTLFTQIEFEKSRKPHAGKATY